MSSQSPFQGHFAVSLCRRVFFSFAFIPRLCLFFICRGGQCCYPEADSHFEIHILSKSC